MWATFKGLTITSGFGVAPVLNLPFRKENCKTDEYEELIGVKMTIEMEFEF
jgi:hypothetical protein